MSKEHSWAGQWHSGKATVCKTDPRWQVLSSHPGTSHTPDMRYVGDLELAGTGDRGMKT